MHCSLGVDVFPCLEALQHPYYWDFTEAASCRQDELLIPLPASFHSLEKG